MTKMKQIFPPEVLEFRRKRAAGPVVPAAPVVKPKCWKQLGDASQFHRHLPDGTCVLKNWSNSVVWTSPLGASYTGPVTGNRRLGDPTGAKKRRNEK